MRFPPWALLFLVTEASALDISPKTLGRTSDVPKQILQTVCVYYCRTYYKAVRVGEEDSGGHVL